MKTRTYVITGPDENGLYVGTCTEEPHFYYESRIGPSHALFGLLWVMTDDSPKPDEDEE